MTAGSKEPKGAELAPRTRLHRAKKPKKAASGKKETLQSLQAQVAALQEELAEVKALQAFKDRLHADYPFARMVAANLLQCGCGMSIPLDKERSMTGFVGHLNNCWAHSRSGHSAFALPTPNHKSMAYSPDLFELEEAEGRYPHQLDCRPPVPGAFSPDFHELEKAERRQARAAEYLALQSLSPTPLKELVVTSVMRLPEVGGSV